MVYIRPTVLDGGQRWCEHFCLFYIEASACIARACLSHHMVLFRLNFKIQKPATLRNPRL
jgi:hypothetical protein